MGYQCRINLKYTFHYTSVNRTNIKLQATVEILTITDGFIFSELTVTAHIYVKLDYPE